jgi:hypothetical protein
LKEKGKRKKEKGKRKKEKGKRKKILCKVSVSFIIGHAPLSE